MTPRGETSVRGLFSRSRSDHVLTGVAGGLGERLGIDPVVVRLAFVVLALAGAAGVVLYLVAMVFAGPPGPDARPSRSPRTSTRQALSVGLVVAGVLLLLREGGLWFGDGVVWPAALAVLGSAVIWTRGDEAERARWGRVLARLPGNVAGRLNRSAFGLRVVAGALLILGGAAAFLTSNPVLDVARNTPLAVAAAITGLGVIVGPWVWRLGRHLREERRERPLGGAGGGGGPPARLRAPDPRADPANRPAPGDGRPGPGPGTGAPGLALRPGAGRGQGPAEHRDRRDRRRGRAEPPRADRDGHGRRCQAGRRAPRLGARVPGGHGQRGEALRHGGAVGLRGGRARRGDRLRPRPGRGVRPRPGAGRPAGDPRFHRGADGAVRRDVDDRGRARARNGGPTPDAEEGAV
ncbi:MAG: PspC domain-containing protein, partial [Actinobacteria bacterium]|nr:PspC domain-containing protein [Actinomycetota bacterium]